MADFKITVISRGASQSFNCSDDSYILDAAEDQGIALPSSCHAGACSTCCGRIVEGSVDQADQSFLDESQLESGLALLCVSYPLSACTIETDMMDPFLLK